MINKLKFFLFLACTCMLGGDSVEAQVVHSGEQIPPPFRLGVGPSAIAPDFESGTMIGVTLWVDYTPNVFNRHVPGLYVSGQVRDLNYHRSASQTDLRENSYQAGLAYRVRHFENWQPYVRGAAGFGSIRFGPISSYSSDSRTIWSVTGGSDFRLSDNLWIRAEYERQTWPGLFNRDLHPRGASLGLVYDFHWRFAQ